MSKESKEKAAVLDSIIGCGLFQVWLYLCCQWVIFAQAWNLVAIVFNKVKPDWVCNDRLTESHFNSTLNDVDKCAIRANCTNLTYIYDFRSFVMEWDLVCEQDYVAYLLLTIQMAGVLAGAPIWGQFSDSYGRKWTLFGNVLGIIVTGGLSSLSPRWKIYSVLNFFVGFFCGGSINTCWVLWAELLSQKHRLWVPALAGWPLAFVLLSLIAYLAKDWKTLLVSINLLSIPALVLILWIGESPRWLLGAGRVDEATRQLKRVARINRRAIDPELFNHIADFKSPNGLAASKGERAGKKYTYWHLFSTRKLALYTVILSITFFCISAVSFGLTFSLDKLSGSVYLNFTFLACLRWLGGWFTVAADIFIRRYGRRVGVVLSSMTISLFSATVVILLLVAPNFSGLLTIVRVLLLLAAALCSPIWTGMGMSGNELFPTPIRNMAVAFCSIWNRLGAVVMPQILYLAKFWKATPYLSFAVLMFTCAVLFLIFIPETKGHPLPQFMPESKKARKKSINDGLGVYKDEKAEQVQTPLVPEQHEV